MPHVHGTLAITMPWLWIRLNAHLVQCDSCAKELDELMSMHIQLIDGIDKSQPDVAASARSVKGRVHREIALIDISNSKIRVQRRLAFACACIGIVLLFGVYINYGRQIAAVFSPNAFSQAMAVISRPDDSHAPAAAPLAVNTPEPIHKQPINQPVQGSVLR
jgi:hypothetical protein